MTGYELAKMFYERHQMEFVRAATASTNEAKQFDYSDARLDDFLVEIGEMSVAAREANDEVARRGLQGLRHRLRTKLNQAAKRERPTRDMTHNFSIEARYKGSNRWRVLLLERYVAERPETITRGFQRSLNFADRSFEQARVYLDQLTDVDDETRHLVASQLAFGRVQIFGIMNSVTLWMKSIRDGQQPDLRALQRRFSSLVNEDKPKRRARGKR